MTSERIEERTRQIKKETEQLATKPAGGSGNRAMSQVPGLRAEANGLRPAKAIRASGEASGALAESELDEPGPEPGGWSRGIEGPASGEEQQEEQTPTKKPPPEAGAWRSDGSSDQTIKRCGKP